MFSFLAGTIRSKPLLKVCRDKFGNTALHCAAAAATLDGKMILLLLSRGANPLIKNKLGQTLTLTLALNLYADLFLDVANPLMKRILVGMCVC